MENDGLAAMETEHAEDVLYFSEMVSALDEAPVSNVDEGVVTSRKYYKVVKSLEEAAAEGIRVISRLRGNDKREFVVRKSAAPKSELSYVAKVGLYLDIKDMMIAHHKDLNARRRRGEKIYFGQNNLVYNSKALQEHYGVSQSMVTRIKKDGDNGNLIERKRPGRKKRTTDEHISV